MKRVLEFIKSHKYFVGLFVLIGFSIVLSTSYSNYFVALSNHRVAEMYIGSLKYSIEIDSNETNTLTVEPGETIIDVDVNNLNPVDTYYKLLYLNNSNITIKYYNETKDTSDTVTSYSNPNDSITSNNTNNLKLLIINNSASDQSVRFSLKGGYINNTLNDISVPNKYSEITTIETPSSNTYFCMTNDTLTQGTEYVDDQYTYAYKQQGISSNSTLWENISDDGWGVQLTDKENTNDVTDYVCTYINNKPIISMSNMFSFSESQLIELTGINTSNVYNMSGMFYNTIIDSLDLSNFDTSNVTDMSGMFSNSYVTKLDLSNFVTNKVTDMHQMFQSVNASSLDISGYDTSNVTKMWEMFANSHNIIELDLSSFDTTKVTYIDSMFFNMPKLKTIYASEKFNTDTVTDSLDMFSNSYNLVGGLGTEYNSSYTDASYAHIDGGTSNPGYFTDISQKPSTFDTDDWATIVKSVKAGNTKHYKVGDTKTIDMGSYGTHTLRVANTSTPSECSTSGFSQTACGFVLEFADIITTHNMNDTNTNIGGWPATSMRTFVNNDIYNVLPTDLKNGIIDTTVISSYGKNDTTNFTSIDKLYLLSTLEVWAQGSKNPITNDTASSLTRQLDYYKNMGVTTGNYSKAVKSDTAQVLKWWWLRSASSAHVDYFFYVYNDGGWTGRTAKAETGVSPAFRIG